jgi:hypothetical protein
LIQWILFIINWANIILAFFKFEDFIKAWLTLILSSYLNLIFADSLQWLTYLRSFFLIKETHFIMQDSLLNGFCFKWVLLIFFLRRARSNNFIVIPLCSFCSLDHLLFKLLANTDIFIDLFLRNLFNIFDLLTGICKSSAKIFYFILHRILG